MTPEQIASEFQEDFEKAFHKATSRLVEAGIRRGATVLYTKDKTKYIVDGFGLDVNEGFGLGVDEGFAIVTLDVYPAAILQGDDVENLKANVADFVFVGAALKYEPDIADIQDAVRDLADDHRRENDGWD